MGKKLRNVETLPNKEILSEETIVWDTIEMLATHKGTS